MTQPETDLLGQVIRLDTPNATDKSCRELAAVAVIRQAIRKKGGQPK